MTFKIAVCAGHGRYKSLVPKVYTTPGKRTPDGQPEWEFNDKLVRAFMKEMEQYENVEVRRFDDPTGKTDILLKDRTDAANAWGADIYISFHHNANTGKWSDGWTGVETYHWGSGKSLELTKLIHPHFVKAYGLRDRGLKNGSHLWIIKATTMPAVLLEGGFMDSTIDIKKLRDDNVLANAGIGVAKGVVEYAKLKKKNVPVQPKPASPTPQPAPVQPKPQKSIDELAQEVIKGLHGIGAEREKSLGSQYSAVQNRVNELLGAKSKPAPKPQKSIDQLAQEVIDGKHGSGDARKKALGNQYDAVQKRVNELLGVKSAPKSTPQPKSIGVGSRVVLSSSASKYATGQNIPQSIKGKTYTVQQVKSDRVLLKEIYSWVYKKDVK